MVLIVVLSLVAGVAAFVVADTPVRRERVEIFARRHGLTVTADSGPRVIAYLAVTRRWRAAGLVFGFVLYILQGLMQSRLGINVVYLLAGWFVGALIAELRLARLTTTRRAASLMRRTPDRYLPRFARQTLAMAVACCIVLTPLAMLDPFAEVSVVRAAVWAAAVLIVAPLTWAATLQVLRRPQPVTAPDLVAADDAIRSRSLHVLAASSATLVLYCVLDQLVVIAAGADLAGPALLVSAVGAVAVPLTGWRMATASWTVRPAITVA